MPATTARRRFALLPDYMLFILGLGAIMLALAAAFARAGPDEPPDDDDTPPCESPASPPEVFYACLRTGTVRERVAAATLIADELPIFYASTDQELSETEDVIDGLLVLVRREPDDWVSRTLLEELHWVQGEPLDRLFREVLREGSINLVAVALQRLTFTRDPLAVEALDDLWERDLPAWIRPPLIAALAEQGSAVHIDDFIRLTRDGDDETRRAAISALGLLGREEGRPALLRAARAGRPGDRAVALMSLADLPFSDETLGEALRASRAGPPAAREAAFMVLERLAHPDADARLIAALEEPLPDRLRAVAGNGLVESPHPDATAALVRLLHAPPSDAGSCLALATARVLYNRDDPDAVPGLLDLDMPSNRAPYPTIPQLIAYLSRDRTRATTGRMPVTTCGADGTASLDPGDVDAEEARPFRIAPPPPLLTIRCWEGPDLPGDPHEWLRVPAGTPARIAGHFERPAESWVEIDTPDADCWVPLAQVAKGIAGVQGGTRDARPRFELDVRPEDLETLPAARLLEAGFLEVFDPGDEVSGVALTADPSVPEQAALLRALLGALPEDPEYPLRVGVETLLESAHSIDGSPRVP